MSQRSFSIGDVLKKGWIKFKEEPFKWLIALFIMFLVSATHPFVLNWIQGNGFIFDVEQSLYQQNNPFHVNLLISFVVFFYYLAKLGFWLGLISMGIRAADGLPVKLSQLFSRFQYVFHLLIAHILYSLIVLAGLILLIFPGFIWGSRFSLYAYFIADRGVGPIEALKLSSKATQGVKWDVFGLLFVSVLLFLAGMASLFIGLFVVLPVLVIAWGVVYVRVTGPVTQPVISEVTATIME
jgi:hypothetical protein